MRVGGWMGRFVKCSHMCSLLLAAGATQSSRAAHLLPALAAGDAPLQQAVARIVQQRARRYDVGGVIRHKHDAVCDEQRLGGLVEERHLAEAHVVAHA